MSDIPIEKISEYLWQIPKFGSMRVPGRVYASEMMMQDIIGDKSLDQVVNVAHLPGILKYSMAMPDIHWGYGFPIGGVAAFDVESGIISPGGVGYDINCGVRLIRTPLFREEIKPRIKDLVAALFARVPSGVGSKGPLRLGPLELKKVLKGGARWAVENGYGLNEDLEYIEENGQMPETNPELISENAIRRGLPQLGTIGSGNHFVEIDYVSEIYDQEAAEIMGLELSQVAVIIHTGSRGFGYQVCDDYIRKMIASAQKFGIELPDRQLCCAPFASPEGREYYEAMNCAINYAFANRQIITHWVRESFRSVVNGLYNEAGYSVVYEVAHNIAKVEKHEVDGVEQDVIVHRKGATRAFPAGEKELPMRYQGIGQPVIIPGDMGRYSYVLAGDDGAMRETFGSSCHGAGRRLSRKKAMKSAKGRHIYRELEDQGVTAMAASRATLVEEIPEAYKDVSHVVDAVEGAGLARKVVQLKPIGVIKG